ncbi:MAG TPA: HAD family hydrolase [Candidatus Limnocylindria bacterium]|nr:HAD family hydrolase [Candidatus Limnocylindria bacterium]
MPPTVLLFDIDGTLVSMRGAGRRALVRAFEAELGRPDVFDALEFAGMTDPAIVRYGLAAAGVPADAASVARLLAAYVRALEDEVRRSTDCFVHPGVEALLDACAARPEVAIGLGTGNVRPGARAKLERLGLYHRFAFGGFGCDHEERARLIAIGAERGAARLGRPRAACRVVVIGDTPRDVAAAHAIGAEAVAVATSTFDVDTLRAAGAAAFPDLTAPGVLEAVLG